MTITNPLRTVRNVKALLSISVCLASALLCFGCRSHSGNTSNAAASEMPVAEAPALSMLLPAVAGSLESGETPMGWFLQHGIEHNTAGGILEALGDLLPMSRFRPDDELTLEFDEAGEAIRFRVDRRNRSQYVVETDGSAWSAREQDPVYRKGIARFEGTVQSSLWESLLREGATPALVMKFADVFAWTFDFLTDCRGGDHFEILAETLYEGDEFVGFGDILAADYIGERGEVDAVRFTLASGKDSYFARDGESLQKIFLKSPLNFRRISSGFTHARFHPILKKYRPHLGIDYAADTGTPVVAIGDGVVTRAGWNGGFGNFVEIKHSRSYITWSGHLSKYGKGIKKGTRVKQGQIIGYVGSTGLSTGPHLDFRMKHNGKFVNPLKIAVPSADPIPAEERTDFRIVSRQLFAALGALPNGPLEAGSEQVCQLLASACMPHATAGGDRIVP